VKNSLAFQNNMDGFTDNFNPGSLVLENNVSIDNKRFNFLFRKSPYAGQVKQGHFEDNRSYRFFVESKYNDVVNGDTLVNNQFFVDGHTVDQNGKIVKEDVSELKNASDANSTSEESMDEQVQKLRSLLN
jgi:hypothetical protein